MCALSASSVTSDERAQYLTYDRQRRRRLLMVLVPTGVGLTGFAALVATITLLVAPHRDSAVEVNDGITLILMLLFSLAWLALRRNRILLTTMILLGATGGGILVTVGIACFSQGISPLTCIQIASLSTLLVLVGMLGDLRTILGATLALNAGAVGILLWAPRTPDLAALVRQQLPLLLSVTLTYQWMVAALMIALWLTYRQTFQALGTAYERAQRLDALKAQFITHINHELRTPIMTLQGYVEYLRLGHETLPETEVTTTLDQASRTADTLVDLLSNILDIRRIETQQSFVPTAVRVREALDGALALLDPRLSHNIPRDLRIHIADDLAIWGDRVRLQQILTNLLANALKYSEPGTPIEVSAQALSGASALLRRRPHGQTAPTAMIEIVVRDYGHGIPQDHLPLLFNRFARLPRDLASNVEGSGLGLYLCKVFAEAMNGAISAESTGIAGEGTAFHLRLPLPPSGAQAQAVSHEGERELARQLVH